MGRLLPNPHLSGPERLRQLFEDLGGTFVKFGQMLALQPDILSLEYCNALFNLLDHVSPFPFSCVEETFAQEFGERVSAIFDSVDAQPLATGSIGQVHVAWLGDRKFAVKVQRPTVERDFNGDIRLMTAFIRVIGNLRLKSLGWLVEPMSEFVSWTREELDFRNEANYMRQHRANARDNPRERIPEILDRFTTRRTLVMEFLEGETLLTYLRALERRDEASFRPFQRLGFNPTQVAANIIDNFLGDVFQHGMFHADLHPANLMVLHGNTVGYIDFGITGTISRYSRESLVSLTLAYTRGDLAGMCEAFFRVSTVGTGADLERFRKELKTAAAGWYEDDGHHVRLKKTFTLVMLDMLTLSRSTRILPERDVIKYIRSAIAIDGLITRFAPSFDLCRHLGQVCDRFLKARLRQSMVSYGVIAGFMSSVDRLVSDGAFRTAEFVRRAADGNLQVRVDLSDTNGQRESLRRRSVYLGATILTISLGILGSRTAVHLGTALFDASMVLLCVALTILFHTVLKLEKG